MRKIAADRNYRLIALGHPGSPGHQHRPKWEWDPELRAEIHEQDLWSVIGTLQEQIDSANSSIKTNGDHIDDLYELFSILSAKI